MSFLQEKQNNAFWCFLTAFCGVWLVCAGIASALILGEVRQSLREREAAIVSGLLAQGVEEETAASALAAAASTQGWALLEKTGRTGGVSPAVYPGTERLARLVPGLLCGGVFGFALCLLVGSAVWLTRREDAYGGAAAVIEGFLKGDFEAHLPSGETGGYYRLLSVAEELARALQSRNEEERRSKHFLQDMISDISHQLKTPLAALSLYLDIMEAKLIPGGNTAVLEMSDIEVREASAAAEQGASSAAGEETSASAGEETPSLSSFVGKARLAVDRMESLVRTLLKMARLDAGGVVFERSCVRAADLAEHAVSQLLARAEREEKRICLEGDPQMQVGCDPGWTAEALENLVKNALDHTEESGHIRIAWEAFAGNFRLSVSDDGRGIPLEDIHHIFKRFYRGGTSQNLSAKTGGAAQPAGVNPAGKIPEGVGLGLPLAKAIVEGQGGVLGVESTPGRGSVFTVTFLDAFLTKS